MIKLHTGYKVLNNFNYPENYNPCTKEGTLLTYAVKGIIYSYK